MGSIYDSETIVQKITEEFEKLKAEYPEEGLYEKLDTAQTKLIKKIEENSKKIIVDGVPRQIFLSFIAGFIVEQDDRKIWYIYQAILSILVIDDVRILLKQRYKKDYETFIDRIYKYGALAREIRLYLDHIDDKALKNEDITNYAHQRYITLIRKMPLIDYQLWDAFMVICFGTNLANNSVPNQTIQLMERQLKKVTYEDQRQRQRPFQTYPEGGSEPTWQQ